MKYIVANWKMNMNMQDVINWAAGFDTAVLNGNVTIIVAPSSPHIFPVAELMKKIGVEISAQDVSIEEKGAHTGETGSFQLKEMCKYAIVGHSERKETPEVVIKKIDACLANRITPIVCFVDSGKIEMYKRPGAMYAWEDPANISKNGVYKEKSTKDIVEGVKKIRAILKNKEPLLYGGSVNGQNIPDLVNIEKLDGVLVGNASLDPKHFSGIVAAY
ncbi:MAG: Triosephosphate isomerase [candidate division WWE3 bacterium GW2011_GWF1_42_14]|uniref:Triosephosphate isomerase n=1 Tax=candidate division WWE3 bacterium GW2011_GWF1_42_14 TaxID=1619138 RepID=A0A0G0YKT9_UNCKA|nr:MAG: Triosephosphate isomerase [candidate division WWE3 bacterium GW2011_GWF1_42_14]